MLAEFKSNIIAECDKKIAEARAMDCEVIAFHLESEEENVAILKYAEMCGPPYDPAFELEYEGVVIVMYAPDVHPLDRKA